MNQIYRAGHSILNQLAEVVQQLSPREYTFSSIALSGSTIGQHVRHTLEFFICLEQGLHKGIVNYDCRERDQVIETEQEMALLVIERIHRFITQQTHDKPLQLEISYNFKGNELIETNFVRELTYNIEHAIHHMAVIKIGIREVAPTIAIPSDFGVAASTFHHRAEAVKEL